MHKVEKTLVSDMPAVPALPSSLSLSPPDAKVSTWIKLCYQLVQQRVKPETVLSYVQSVQSSSWAISSRFIVYAFLANAHHGCNVADPMMWEYLKILYENDLIRIDDILIGLFDRSVHRIRLKKDGTGQLDSRLLTALRQDCFFVPTELESDILEFVAGIISSPSQRWYPWSEELFHILTVLTTWLHEICQSDSYPEIKSLLLPEFDLTYSRSHEFYDSVGTLLIALLQNPDVGDMCIQELPKEFVASFGRSVATFSLFWGTYSLGLATKLDSIWSTNFAPVVFGEGESADALIPSFTESLNSQNLTLSEIPYLYSRSGLLIFLNSLMVSYPLTDESLILNYLVCRYKGDAPLMATQLVVATFDLLANGMYRNESSDVMFALRSLAINKIPILLAIISTTIAPPTTIEACIANALVQIDPQIFPSFSESFMMGQGKTLSDVRQDFISACHLHGLLSKDAKADVFGDRLLDSSPTTDSKLIKQELVKKYSSALDQIGVLIEGLESLDGNASAIVAALVEIVHSLASSRELSGLRSIANVVSRKTFFLDVILQFSSPTCFLRPFCEVLDSCKYDDDQTEFQPVYEDFSSVMLMVQAFLFRFKFKPVDLGISPQSFIGKYILKDFSAKPIDSLSAESKRRLALWSRGLFDLDGNIDEAIAQCRPQQFYLLVPELFREILEGVTNGTINQEAVKSGFDFLFESFLVPSIIDGVEWLCRHAGFEADAGDSGKAEVLQLIQRLMMKPTARSGDAPAMHRVVLSVTGLTLQTWLSGRLGKEPGADPAIRRMLEILQTITFYDREANVKADIKRWISCPGGIASALREMFDSLVRWHMPPSVDSLGVSHSQVQSQRPPSQLQASPAVKYTHRLFLSAVYELLGPNQVAELLVERIVHHFKASSAQGRLAIDVAVSLASAPSAVGNSNLNNPFRATWPACGTLMPSISSPGTSPSPPPLFPLASSPVLPELSSQPFQSLRDEEQFTSELTVADFVRLNSQALKDGVADEGMSSGDEDRVAVAEATHRLTRELDSLTARAVESFATSTSQVVAYLLPQSAQMQADLMAIDLAAQQAAAAAAAGDLGLGLGGVGGPMLGTADPSLAAMVAAAAAESVATEAALVADGLGIDSANWMGTGGMMYMMGGPGGPAVPVSGASDPNGMPELDLFSLGLGANGGGGGGGRDGGGGAPPNLGSGLDVAHVDGLAGWDGHKGDSKEILNLSSTLTPGLGQLGQTQNQRLNAQNQNSGPQPSGAGSGTGNGTEGMSVENGASAINGPVATTGSAPAAPTAATDVPAPGAEPVDVSMMDFSTMDLAPMGNMDFLGFDSFGFGSSTTERGKQ